MNELLQSARRHDVESRPGAQDRVWRAMRRGRAPRRTPFLVAGLAAAACAIFFLVHRREAPQLADLVNADAELVVAAGTRGHIERWDANDVQLRVDEGSVLFHVQPRGQRGPFVVHTPRFVARVVGTVFRISVEPGGASSIAVAEGAVEVTPDGEAAHVVHAHESWPADAQVAPSVDELRRLHTAHVTPLDFSPPTHACGGTADARLRCELAIAQDAPARDAETALYQAGWIAWHELHDAHRALTLWSLQRTRFPDGVLRREVQESVIDALVASRELHGAQTEIEHYLAAEPDDLRAAELHFVLATVERELDGGCKRAKAELELALAHPAGAWVGRAREALRGCSAR